MFVNLRRRRRRQSFLFQPLFFPVSVRFGSRSQRSRSVGLRRRRILWDMKKSGVLEREENVTFFPSDRVYLICLIRKTQSSSAAKTPTILFMAKKKSTLSGGVHLQQDLHFLGNVGLFSLGRWLSICNILPSSTVPSSLQHTTV